MQQAEAIALDRARDGDEEAFRLLVEEHGKKMFALAYRMTGNEQDAEDVVQETFLRAYRNLARYDSRAQFSSWLHRIAANHAIDLLRRRKRWRKADLDQLEETAPLRAANPDPEREVFGHEVQRRIEAGMEQLSPRERVAFVLRHHQGLSIAEIGRVLGTRENATKNHVFRAVRKLRRSLGSLVEKER
jgi:RNA polymerase sigma-70 factor (ECF subfamily)